MAGKTKRGDDAPRLDSRSGRAALKARGAPYFVEISENACLGYRKGATRAVWLLRRWLGDRYEFEKIGFADDRAEADAERILSFNQARDRAVDMAKEAAKAAKGATPRRRSKPPPLTVSEAMADYLAFVDQERKSGAIARNYEKTSILPTLGAIPVRDLTTKTLRDWLRDLAERPRFTHGRKGEPSRLQPPATTDEERRRRKSSANRIFNVLRAALNYAFQNDEDGRVPSDAAWKKVKAFRDVDAPKVRWLSTDEMQRLVNASNEPFKSLVLAGLFSGCRYGELCRLVVGDFDPDSDTLLVRVSKSGKSRHVTLTKEASNFFRRLTKGRDAGELLLTNPNGKAWERGQQARPMKEACSQAHIAPAVGFHCLRHTFASHAVQHGVPLLIVAANLGHSTTKMCEKHYVHLSAEHVRKTIQDLAQPFGLVDDDSNVVTLARR
jgi:integrase